MNLQQHLPKTMNYMAMDIDDIMNVTARLTDILAAESNLLGAMRVKELAPLQQEKQKLSDQLTAFQKQLAGDNRIVKEAPPEAQEKLVLLTEDLYGTIEENMRRTVIAQNVNQRVIHTLLDAITESQRPQVYNRDGQTNNGAPMAVSLNINERA